jgi:hypothetical protein
LLPQVRSPSGTAAAEAHEIDRLGDFFGNGVEAGVEVAVLAGLDQPEMPRRQDEGLAPAERRDGNAGVGDRVGDVAADARDAVEDDAGDGDARSSGEAPATAAATASYRCVEDRRRGGRSARRGRRPRRALAGAGRRRGPRASTRRGRRRLPRQRALRRAPAPSPMSRGWRSRRRSPTLEGGVDVSGPDFATRTAGHGSEGVEQAGDDHHLRHPRSAPRSSAPAPSRHRPRERGQEAMQLVSI